MVLSKAQVKRLRGLAAKKSRKESGEFLLEGFRLIQEAVNSTFAVKEVYYLPDVLNDPSHADVISSARRRSPEVHPVTERELGQITDTVNAQGIVAVVESRQTPLESMLVEDETASIIVALDAVTDPGNLGSLIRTCDWFGVQGIILGHGSVELANPKVLRSTMGSVFHVPVSEGVDILAALSLARQRGYTIYVTDSEGEQHFDMLHFAQKSCIVFGNEAWGATDQIKELADARVAVRRYGAAESLNVGVACGVVLSGLHRLYND